MIHPAFVGLTLGAGTFLFWYGLAVILNKHEKRKFIKRKKRLKCSPSFVSSLKFFYPWLLIAFYV